MPSRTDPVDLAHAWYRLGVSSLQANHGMALRPVFLQLPEPSTVATELDQMVIRTLQRDGRISYSQMAEELGTNERTVAARVSALLEQNIIEITVVSSPGALGYGFGGLIAVDCDIARPIRDTLESLISLPQVSHAVATTGLHRFLVEAFVGTTSQFEDLLGEVSSVLGPLTRFDVHPYASVEYVEWDYGAASAPTEPIASGVRKGADHLTPVDREIMKHLSVDGRRSFRAIARELGISEGQVRQRYTKLTSSGVFRIQAIVNPQLLGYRAQAWLFLTVAPGADSLTVTSQLAKIPGITYVSVCLGRFAVIAELVAGELSGIHQIVDQEIRPLPAVASIESVVSLGTAYKRVPLL